MRNRKQNSLDPEQGFAPGATWRSYIAEAPAWLIVIGALSVSFWTQVFTVNEHDLAYWESLIWAASTDLGTIACLFLAREGAYRGTATWGAWVIAIGCATMSVEFNVVRAVQVGDWLSVQIHVWMPALALGTWYWLLHGRKRQWSRSPEPDPEPTPSPLTRADLFPDPTPEPPGAALPEPALLAELPAATGTQGGTNGRERVTLARARAEYRKLAAKGPVTGAALGRALGVSAPMGCTWKRKVEAAAKPTRPFRVETERRIAA